MEVDNRLRGKTGTSDIVLKILVGDTLTELQLVIDLNVSAYEFAHKIYELMRSKFFTTLSTLQHANQQLTNEYINYIQALVKNNPQKNDYREKCHFEDIR